MSRTAATYPAIEDARLAFLGGLIDDAGMFPPASLPLDDAVARHAEDRVRRGWLLGRLLCRASDLDALALAIPDAAAWHVGVICDTGDEDDFVAAGRFAERVPSSTVDGVESKLRGADVVAEVARLCANVERHLPSTAAVFAEIPLDGDWRGVVPAAAAALADVRGGGPWPRAALAAKVRCGGTTPGSAPSADQVAAVIVECAGASVPLKATAGLHHPVRHRDEATGDMAHGFLNVVGAVLLLHRGAIGPADVVAVVGEEDPAAFSLTATAFSWRGRSIAAAEIGAGRVSAFPAFGSCSIDEPVDDLTAMGILPLEGM